MLITLNNGAPDYNGRVQESIWTGTAGRIIARARIRPTTVKQRQRFVAPWTLAAAEVAFEGLAEETQDEWNTWAESNQAWPLQGSPRYVDGQTYFANFYTVEILKDSEAPIPDVPSSLVDWQDRPKFFEIATWESGTYTLKAETEFESGTNLLFSGLPPTKIGFKPEWNLEQIIGNHTFWDGLQPDDTTDVVHSMMAAAFGPIDSSLKIWGRCWETYYGFCRVIKDPCGPDPGAAPPPAATSFDFEIYNDHGEEVEFGDFYFEVDSSTQIGHIDVTGLGAFETLSGTVNLTEGYDIDDINWWWSEGQWLDFSFWDTGLVTEFTLDPFQYTIFSEF